MVEHLHGKKGVASPILASGSIKIQSPRQKRRLCGGGEVVLVAARGGGAVDVVVPLIGPARARCGDPIEQGIDSSHEKNRSCSYNDNGYHL